MKIEKTKIETTEYQEERKALNNNIFVEMSQFSKEPMYLKTKNDLEKIVNNMSTQIDDARNSSFHFYTQKWSCHFSRGYTPTRYVFIDENYKRTKWDTAEKGEFSDMISFLWKYKDEINEEIFKASWYLGRNPTDSDLEKIKGEVFRRAGYNIDDVLKKMRSENHDKDIFDGFLSISRLLNVADAIKILNKRNIGVVVYEKDEHLSTGRYPTSSIVGKFKNSDGDVTMHNYRGIGLLAGGQFTFDLCYIGIGGGENHLHRVGLAYTEAKTMLIAGTVIVGSDKYTTYDSNIIDVCAKNIKDYMEKKG